jgi:hypothetical protein
MVKNSDQLLSAIDAYGENAYGTDTNSDLSAHRARMIEAYLGYNTSPAPVGRSQVVDRSVFETINTMQPSLTRIFCGSSDEVCKFMPIGPEDEQAAEQTTAYVNWVVAQKNNWEQIFTDWCHDALLLGNGYALAYWDESERRERDSYKGQSEDQLALLLQDGNVKVLEHSEYPDEEGQKMADQQYQQAMQQYQQMAQQAQQQAMQTGQPPQLPPPPQQPSPAMLHDVVVETVKKTGQVCLHVLPPEHCRVAADTPDWTLKDCPYFEFRQQKTIAELRQMGFEVEDDIGDDEGKDDDDTVEDNARDRFNEKGLDDTDELSGALRKVWTRMIWVKAADDQGTAMMHYVIMVGRTILYAEPCGRIHVASITPKPMPHRHPGMSIAEVVYEDQVTKTDVLRAGIDSLKLSVAPRQIISNAVNLDDFLNWSVGSPIRMKDDGALPGQGHVVQVEQPFIFDKVIGTMEYLDQTRQNKAGTNRYFSGTDAGAINKTASGTMALQNMASQQVEHIARMMAPGVEYLFSCVHELISKHESKSQTIKLRGQWTPIDPQSWKTKRDVRISVGVGAGNKDSMAQHLMQMYGIQTSAMQMGARIANESNLYATAIELAKLGGHANPDKFVTDPSKLPPPQPQPPPEVMVAQMKAQADQQGKQMELQADQQKFAAEAQLNQQQAGQQMMLEREKAASELQLKREEMMLKAELAQFEANLQAETQFKIAQLNAGIAVQTKEMDAQVQMATKEKDAETQTNLKAMDHQAQASAPKEDEKVGKMVESLSKAIENLNRPKKRTLIRDKDGRLTGAVETPA